MTVAGSDKSARDEQSDAAHHQRIAAEAFQRIVLESSLDCIKVLDREGRLVYMNPGGARVLEIDEPSQILGASYPDFWNDEDRQAVRTAIESAKSGRVGSFTGFFPTRRSKTPKWWNVVVSPIFNEEGQVPTVLAVSRDVTHQRLAEIELRRSEERFRNVADAIPQLVWTATPDGHNDFVNRRCLEYTGTPATPEGVNHWMDALHPDDAPSAFAKWRRCIETGSVFECEYRLKGTDGLYRWFLGRAEPIRSSSGEIIQWFGTATDVESHKQLVQEVQQSRDELEVILQVVTDGVVVLNHQNQFVYANDAGAQLCGFKSGPEMTATPISEVMKGFELLDEQDQPFPTERLPGRLALEGMKKPPEVLVKSKVRKSGQVRWSVVNAAPVFDDRGRVKYAVSVIRDFTQRKAVEDSLQVLAQSGVLLASSLDYRATLESIAHLLVPELADWCSIAVREFGGLAVPQEVFVAHKDPKKVEWARRLNEKYPPNWNAQWGAGKVLHTGCSELHPEIPEAMIAASARDDEHLQIIRDLGLRSVIMVPLKARDTILGVMTLVTAESGRRYTEADLRVAEDLGYRAGLAVQNALLYTKAQSSIEARDEFLSIASHELKTPITSMKLQLEMTRRKISLQENLSPAPERLAQVFDSAIRQVERLTALVEDMLDISRIQAGKLGLNRERFDLSCLVQEVVERLEDQFEVARIPVHFEVMESLVGEWDKSRIDQVIVNLLTNAIKYAPGAPIRIRSITHAGFARLTIQDSGKGVAVERRERIFDRFERATTSRNITGLGLGLYIVKEITEAHRGRISLVCPEGDGACFQVELPLGP